MLNQGYKELKDFFHRHEKLVLNKGHLLLSAGSNPEQAYYLQKGSIKQYVVSASGKELIMHIFQPSSVIPISYILNKIDNEYYYETITRTTLYCAPLSECRKFILSNNEVLSFITSNLISGIQRLQTRIINTGMYSSYAQVVSFLIYLSRHYGTNTDKGLLLKQKFTHEDISKLVGVSRERVSIEMSELAEKGLIKYDKRKILIPNILALEKEVKSA